MTTSSAPWHRGSRSRLGRVAAAALAVPLVLAGCGADGIGANGTGEAGSGPRVAASFYPLAYVAERVGGDHADVVNLTSPGVEPHDLELTVQQTADIADADLVVYEKHLQPAVDEAVEQNGPSERIEVTETVDLLPIGEDPHDDEHADPHADEQADAHDDEHGHAHADEHGHAETDVDPHFWLDPLRMAEVAEEVHRRLADLDPEHADDYAANLDALREDLERLDADLEAGLADCTRDTVVVSHDAFGYLERYGLHFEPIAGLSPDAEPSAAHLARLADLIESEGITTVFSETLVSPAMSRTLARDLGLETAVLDPVEGLSDATAGEDYLSLMRTNLRTLQKANDCR